MQAQSVSLTFTHVNREKYGGQKQYHCLRITSKATSAKSEEVSCCWVGNPVGGKQEMAGKEKRTDVCTVYFRLFCYVCNEFVSLQITVSMVLGVHMSQQNLQQRV